MAGKVTYMYMHCPFVQYITHTHNTCTHTQLLDYIIWQEQHLLIYSCHETFEGYNENSGVIKEQLLLISISGSLPLILFPTLRPSMPCAYLPIT